MSEQFVLLYQDYYYEAEFFNSFEEAQQSAQEDKYIKDKWWAIVKIIEEHEPPPRECYNTPWMAIEASCVPAKLADED